jgi:hypothetical protein
MAFLPMFSGTAYERGKHYKTITLMCYQNTNPLPHNPPHDARKYCYIVKCGDLPKIFANAGVTLNADQYNMHSFWNRNHPIEGKEYGVEICQDDNKEPVYIVYDKHWMHGNAEAQRKIYLGIITPNEAVKLDAELRKHDITGKP